MAKKGFVPFAKKGKGKDEGCAPGKMPMKPFKKGGMVKGKKGC